MKTPKRIEPLVEAGLVDSVMREMDSARDDHAARLRYQQFKREEGR